MAHPVWRSKAQGKLRFCLKLVFWGFEVADLDFAICKIQNDESNMAVKSWKKLKFTQNWYTKVIERADHNLAISNFLLKHGHVSL